MSVESDLGTLRAFLADFEPYLKSDVVYWTVGHNLPALTIGGVLFLRRTLAARRGQLSPAQIAEFDQWESQASLVFNRWPANIEKKALREISNRLNVWASALDELGDNYSHAVQNRAYLALLMPIVRRLTEAEPYRTRLGTLEARLRSRFVPGDFIWEPALAPAFPGEEFWFLYGKPKRGE